MNRTTWPGTLLGLLASTLLAACSAIQIDVDVYKGPLSHEPEIQIQQFAATAIAAKPLLSSLRTDLEIAYRHHTLHDPLTPQEQEDLRRKTSYTDAELSARLARFVNGALSSYDDLGDPAVQDLRQAHQRLSRAMQRLEINTQDRELGKSIKAGPDNAFAQAYRRFLCGDAQLSCEAVPSASVTYRDEPYMVYPQDRKGHCPPALARQQACTEVARSNAGFDLIASLAPVALHSRHLHGTQQPAFIRRVNEIGQAYGEARTAMREVLRAAVAILRTAHTAPRTAAIDAVSRTAVIATQLPFLAAYLESRIHPDVSDLPAAKELLRLWQLKPGSLVGDTAARARGALNPYPRMSRDMLALSRRLPLQMAELLQAVDIRLPQLGRADRARLALTPAVDTSYRDNLQDDSALNYGLARSLIDSTELGEEVAKLDADVGSLGANASGFETARPSDGIDTLTQRYRDALVRANGKPSDPQVDRAVMQLQESLLFFAERVLLVTNTLTQRVLKDEISGLDDATLAKFAGRMATLQTLGNTLLLHANDLTRRRQHELQQGLRGSGEALAAAQVYAPSPAVAFDAWLLSMQADLRQLERSQNTLAQADSAGNSALQAVRQQLEQAEKDLQALQGPAKAASDQVYATESVLRTIAQPNRITQALPAPSDAALLAQERRDRQQVQRQFEAFALKTPEVLLQTGRDSVVEALAQAVRSLDDPKSAVDPIAARRKQAQSFFSSERASTLTIDERPTTPAGVYQAILSTLETTLAAQQKAAMQAKVRADEAEKLVTQLRTQRDDLLTQQQASQARAEALAARLPRHEQLRSIALEHRQAVIDKASQQAVRDAAGLHRLLIDEIKTSAAKASGETQKQLQEAVNSMSRLTPPARITLDAKGTSSSTPREVLDQVIAALRHQRIEATASGETQRAANLAQAIEQAYEARQASTFLRPAADYLKSVYSSTALADGPESPYKNLLTDYLRYVKPDAWDDHSNYQQITRDAKENAEKLFWQNINRVTVSGGGATNTVLAKDDVGNWYLKSYSADPSAVIQSAQSLALFGMGRKLDSNLLRRAELQRRVDDTTLGSGERERAREALGDMGPDKSLGLRRVNDRLREQYLRDTRGHAEQLAEQLSGLPAQLTKAAQAHAAVASAPAAPAKLRALADEHYTVHLSSARSTLRDAASLPASKSDLIRPLNDAIVACLRGLLKFRRALVETISSTSLDSQDDGAKAARTLVVEHVDGLLKNVTDKQNRLLDRLDDGLQLIGEVRSQP
ncbi:hypothetical protein [Aquabacterium sp. OR-4]|uniref:hypothetical protein n=1 Tax=Aquabacterium sp. OR-4 TaxID=2978127 RepID=UPI0028C877FA|nr:hypothetical protein [Aquabacterium sp. OR-4]MDT7835738.1 hypothetical protein [Aquabacterium sp. OR-4]